MRDRTSALLIALASCRPQSDASSTVSASAASVTATASASPSAPSAGRALPHAENVVDMIAAPLVEVAGIQVLVDGVTAGTTRPVEEAGRMHRLDEEFALLKAKRETWKSAHPGEPFPGMVLLQMEETTKAVVVKSVLQTAAFAGYPNLSFVVESLPKPGETARRARIGVDAQVPGPPRPAGAKGAPDSEPTKTLTVDMRAPDKFVLSWKKGATLVAVVDVPRKATLAQQGSAAVPRFPDLAEKLAAEWKAQGEHPDPSDKRLDEAILQVDDATELRIIIAVIDAILAPKRDKTTAGRVEKVSAFNLTFSVR